MSVGIIILAAGQARRMGEPKLLMPLAGRPLLQHAVDAGARAAASKLVVVLGSDIERHRAAIQLPAHGKVVRNPEHDRGQATSLIVGIHALGDLNWAIVLLADQPGMSAETVVRVARATGTSQAPIVRARYTDGPGHPVALSCVLWPRLRQLTGDAGARVLIAGSDVEWVDVDGPQPPDIDTPEDYARVEREFSDR